MAERTEPTGPIAKEGIELFTLGTPNGYKISILLEELKEAYGDKAPKVTYQTIDISKGTQKEEWFIKINPNGRIPAIIDHDRNDFAVFEGASILSYLTKHYDPENKVSFPYESDNHSVAEQWISWQHGGIGPMQGQANHFLRAAPIKIPWGIQRYVGESERLYGILDARLKDRDFVAGPGRGKFSIADISLLGWANVTIPSGIDVPGKFPNVQAWLDRSLARPGVQRGFAVPSPSKNLNHLLPQRFQEDPEAKEKFEETKKLIDDAKKQYNYNIQQIMTYSIKVNEPSLGAFPETAKDKPHHVRKGSKTTSFQNPHPSWHNYTAFQVGAKFVRGHLDGSLKVPNPKTEVVPIRKPEFLPSRFGPESGSSEQQQQLRATWLGHACHYVEFPSGLRVLFDPVLEDRCSPLTFMGPKRYTRTACLIADLPFLDAVVISHSHYDHLSLPTVREIQRRFPGAHFFVGLGLRRWFVDSGVENVTEMDWWEDVDLKVKLGEGDGSKGEGEGEGQATITATISCLPAQHMSSRYGFDQNLTLWCSWAVKSTGTSQPQQTQQRGGVTSPSPQQQPRPVTKSVYFGGDTGYRAVPQLPATADDHGEEYAHLPTNPDFRAIGELRGPFDLGLIPIGAYAPRYLMSHMHADPFDAVDIFRDTRCTRAVAIHWGTWALTTEPVTEPPGLLREALRRRGIEEEGVFDVCDIGETLRPVNKSNIVVRKIIPERRSQPADNMPIPNFKPSSGADDAQAQAQAQAQVQRPEQQQQQHEGRATGAGANTGAGVTREKTAEELEADRLYEEAMEDEYAKRDGGS
ncbi:hypothetical protein SLS53_001582 [Cytospora paraplurivora]|uniref:Uncharacterized protein n=1 Tax=Cytospora paraplurivora TaxID=2898453 RepID=A0AAN9UNK1_9PEZI